MVSGAETLISDRSTLPLVAADEPADPGKRPEPLWLRVVRLVVMYLEFVLGALALLLSAAVGTLTFVRWGHGAHYGLLVAIMLAVAGGLLILGGLALRRRHPLWWIPHLLFVVPLLLDLIAMKLR